MILTGKCVSHDGKILATFAVDTEKGATVRTMIARLDAAHPNCWAASIRGESTSDGTHHGPGRGKVLASREPRTLESGFYNGWIVE